MKLGLTGFLPRNGPISVRCPSLNKCRSAIEFARSTSDSVTAVCDRRTRHMKPFLTANWRYLAMLNYVVDPALVEPLVPPSTEIDYENGETFVSVVGFLFLDTRLLGLPIPLHRDFEELNLRFYVKRKSADTWRRGVGFVRELVPRRAIALVARAFYGERYFALPMKHNIEHVDAKLSVEYCWRRGKKWEFLKMSASGEPQSISAG
jgi:uncharacterized protein